MFEILRMTIPDVHDDPSIPSWSQCISSMGEPSLKFEDLVEPETPQIRTQIVNSTSIIPIDDLTLELRTTVSRLNSQAGGDTSNIYAENMHLFIKAKKEITAIKKRFDSGQLEEQKIMSDILKVTENVSKKLLSSFSSISHQFKKAADSNKLLQCVSNHTALFSFSSEVDSLRVQNKFDEMSRMIDKLSKYDGFRKQPLFSTAIISIEDKLKDVSEKLIEHLRKFNESSLNKNQIDLLIKIRQRLNSSNPVLDLIVNPEYGMFHRMTPNFKVGSEEKECSQIEKLISFCRTLVPFLGRNEFPEHQFFEIVKKIHSNSIDFLHQNIPLGLIKFHKSVVPIFEMWSNLTHQIDLFEVFDHEHVDDYVLEMRNREVELYLYNQSDLHRDYLKSIQMIFESVYVGKNPINNLVKMLIALSKETPLSGNQRENQVFIYPLLSLLDEVHSKLLNDEDLLVQVINDLESFLLFSIPKLLTSLAKKKIDLQNNVQWKGLVNAVVGLKNIANDRLVFMFTSSIQESMWKSFFGSGVNWNDENLEVIVDSWSFFAINKLIHCRAKWGEIYDLLKPQLFNNISSLLYHTITYIPAISNNGQKRINRSISNFEYVSGCGDYKFFATCVEFVKRVNELTPRRKKRPQKKNNQDAEYLKNVRITQKLQKLALQEGK